MGRQRKRARKDSGRSGGSDKGAAGGKANAHRGSAPTSSSSAFGAAFGSAKRPSKKQRDKLKKQLQQKPDAGEKREGEIVEGKNDKRVVDGAAGGARRRVGGRLFSTRVDLNAAARSTTVVGGDSGRGGGEIRRSPTVSSGKSIGNGDTAHLARQKLAGGQFRWLNQQLYTQRGDSAARLFAERPQMFEAYHLGFAAQVRSWPVNPLDSAIALALALPDGSVVADMGCGEARLSAEVDAQRRLCRNYRLEDQGKGVNQKKRKRSQARASVPEPTSDDVDAGLEVFAFDLAAANNYVTVSDIAHVPLADGSVDLCVFCLSLMGTNYADYLAEAHRILRVGGSMFIAEVRSRFEEASRTSPLARTEDEPDPAALHTGEGVRAFREAVEAMGFNVDEEDSSNKMFIKWTFRKSQSAAASKRPVPALRACAYKKR